MLSYGKAVILGAYCDTCLYMLHVAIDDALMLVVRYQCKTTVNKTKFE